MFLPEMNFLSIGMDTKDLKNIEGLSMWQTLLEGSEKSPRKQYPYNIDPAQENNTNGAIRVGDWKYFQGMQIKQFIIPVFPNTSQ